MEDFKILSPAEFREMRTAGEDKSEAYKEFLRTCRALDLKANTALSQQADTIRNGAVADFSRNYIGGAGLQAMSTLLSKNTQLRELRLPRNGLHNDAVVFFCRSMKQHNSLAVIDFTGNGGISLAGGLALLSLAQQRPGIIRMELTDTQVPAAVLKKIEAAIGQNRMRGSAAAAPRGVCATADDINNKDRRTAACTAHKEGNRHRSSSSSSSSSTASSSRSCPTAQPKRKTTVTPQESRLSAAAAAHSGIHQHVDTWRSAGSRSTREASRAANWARREQQLLSSLRTRLEVELSNGSASLPPAASVSGWRVLEVAILCPPCIFISEIDVLIQRVFPRLNEELQPHKTLLMPLVNPPAPSSGTAAAAGLSEVVPAGSYLHHLHLSATCDVVADVERSRFVTIELIGDRTGDYQHATAAQMLRAVAPGALVVLGGGSAEDANGVSAGANTEKPTTTTMIDANAPLYPVLYTAHEAALEHSRWIIVALRRDTKRMSVPPALAPLLSSEPPIERPDKHRAVVKTTLTESTLLPPSSTLVGNATLTGTFLSTAQDTTAGSLNGATAAAATATATTTIMTKRSITGTTADVAKMIQQSTCRIASYHDVEKRKWLEHQDFKAHVLATVPAPELVIEDYRAVFAGTGDDGRIHIGELDDFTEAVYARLRTLLLTLLPHTAEAVPEDFVGPTAHQQRLQLRVEQRLADLRIIEAAARIAMQKKSITNRLNLYVVTPPSRNSLVLSSSDAYTLTSLFSTCAARLLSMPYAYTTAVHSARSTATREEPTDLRDVIVHVLSQLTVSEEVLRYINTEVDITRLRRFFAEYLSGGASAVTQQLAIANGSDKDDLGVGGAAGLGIQNTAATAASEGNVVVVLLDGLDEVDVVVEPCKALRVSEGTGMDVWDGIGSGSSPSSGANAEPQQIVEDGTPASRKARARNAANAALQQMLFMPMCLSRNVRIIATCVEGNERLKALAGRGRDSVEVLPTGPCSANDVEQMLSPAALERLGVNLSDDDFVLCRDKADSHSPEYLRYLIDAVQSHNEVPSFQSQTHLLQQFPGTVAEAANRVLDNLFAVAGSPLTHRVAGLLMVARWGILEPELRALLKVVPRRFNQIIRVLRPALEADSSAAGGCCDGNALRSRVRLHSRSFIAALAKAHLRFDCTAEADKEVWHGVLAQHYMTTVQRAMMAERADMNSSSNDGSKWNAKQTSASTVLSTTLSPTSAFERNAVKELPYHLAQAGMWQLFDRVVLSAPFLTLVYRSKLAYQFTRDLIGAFNLRHERYLLGEDIGAAVNASAGGADEDVQTGKCFTGTFVKGNTQPDNTARPSSPDLQKMRESQLRQLPPVLSRHRDYVYFVRAHSATLLEHPHLVLQIAVERVEGSGFVQMDAKEYLHKLVHQISYTKAQNAEQYRRAAAAYSGGGNDAATRVSDEVEEDATVFFSVTNARRARLHLGAIVSTEFNPNGRYLVTGSNDRSICWSNPVNGAAIFYGRQPTSRVRRVAVCATSAYVAAVTDDRLVYLYDAAFGKLISRNSGEYFSSPISSCAFSARGRYYFVATDDLTVRVFSTEKGQLLVTLRPSDLLSPQQQEREEEQQSGQGEASIHTQRNYIQLLPSLIDDECFTTTANATVRTWHMAPTFDSASSPATSVVTLNIGAVRRAEWCYEPCPPNLVNGFEDEKHLEERMSRYALVQPVNSARVCLLDLHRQRIVAQFSIPALAALAAATVTMSTEAPKRGDSLMNTRAPPHSSKGAGKAVDEKKRGTARVRHFATSPNHQWLAIATEDGRIALFRLNWKQFAADDASGEEHKPVVVLAAFRLCAVTDILGLSFRRDSSALLAVGNLRILKYWNLSALSAFARVSSGDCFVGVHGEFLLENEATCLDVSKAPLAVEKNGVGASASAAEIAIGDVSGNVTMLTLWSPLH